MKTPTNDPSATRLSRAGALVLLFLLGFGILFAQPKQRSHKLTMSGHQISLAAAFSLIKQETGLTVFYGNHVLDDGVKVTFNFESASLETVLDQLLDNRNIRYEIRRDQVIVLDRNPQPVGKGRAVQQTSVSGIVRDTQKSALAGATVTIKGTARQVSTDNSGHFHLEIPGASAVLVVTMVGYAAQEARVNAGDTLQIELVPGVADLDEVVVIGYGTMRRRDLTGSVASVSGEAIERMPITSLDQALQGQVAGVEVMQTSGQPGGGITVRIRGSNSISAGNEPLYVIDGMPVYNDNSTTDAGVTQSGNQNPLATINPQDIESMEILKDASATAIYGSRGANGVVLITTKQGRSGENKVSFDGTAGVQQVRRILPVLNAREFAIFANEAHRNGYVYLQGREDPGEFAIYSAEQVEAFGEGVNWQEAIFRTAPRTNYNLSISGGNPKTQYAVSGNYLDQQGTIIHSDFKRALLRVNLKQDVSDRFRFGNNLVVSRSWANLAYTGVGSNVGPGPSVVLAALSFNPILPVTDPETGEYTFQNSHPGEGGGSYQVAVPYYNPVAYATRATNQNASNRILGSLYGEYDLIDNLKLRVSLGVDLLSNKQNHFVPGSISIASGVKGTAAVGSVHNVTLTNENTLSYSKDFNANHHIDVVGGLSIQRFDQERVSASAQGFSSDVISFHNLAAGSTQNPGQSETRDWSLLSYLARLNYRLYDRYLFTLTARADGSSRFGSGNRFGFFPSGAFAWRLSEEPFFGTAADWMSLKIRTSYGVTGNQEIPLYQSQAVLNESRYILNGQPAIGFKPTRIGNPDLKWETTYQYDAGIDVGFWNERLTLTADYYRKVTRDLLLAVFLPPSSGFQTAMQNIGSTRNTGIELTVSGTLIDREQLSLKAGLNIAHNRNIVTDLGDESYRFLNVAGFHPNSQPVAILEVGKPIGNFYGWTTDGFFDSAAEVEAAPPQTAVTGATMIPGTPRFVDRTNNGVVDGDDRTVIGNALPDFSGGFSFGLTYKQFDCNTNFTYSVGNEILNATRQQLEFLNGRQNNMGDVRHRWSPSKTVEENQHAQTGIATNPNAVAPFAVYDRWIENGTYLRMSNFQVGYRIPVEQLGMKGLRSARLYVSGQNLLTFTEYGGYDPEVNRFGQDNVLRGYDINAYPISKSVLFGINIGL